MRIRDLENKLNKPMALISIVSGFLTYSYHWAMATKSRFVDRLSRETDNSIVEAKYPRAIFLGDSFTKGVGGSRYGGYVRYAGKAAGLDARPSGVGATGIVADGGGADGKKKLRDLFFKKKFRDRLSTEVFPFNPKVVVIAGGLNDAPLIENGSLTLDEYRAEYDALIADIKAGLPEAEIVVLGPFSPGSPTNPPSSLTDIRDANKAAAQAAGVAFIDAFYFDEENKSSYITADGGHPNDAGHEYLGEKLGADLEEVLK